MEHEMDLQGAVEQPAPRHFFRSRAINLVAELHLTAITNQRSHRHQIPELLSKLQKLPTRFAEDPFNCMFCVAYWLAPYASACGSPSGVDVALLSEHVDVTGEKT